MKYPFLDLGEVNAPYMDRMAAAAEKVIRSGRYIGGEEVALFEQELAALTGTHHAVGVSNGLDALRLILRAYVEMGRLSKGDKVAVQANTYIASFLAITDAGLTPVPVDVDPVTLNIDTARLEERMDSGVKALMAVNLYGRVAWDDRMRRAVERNGWLLIEDNAQAIGARSPLAGIGGGHVAGSLGHAAGMSFYPTKNVGALGDAGAVTTDDAELAETVRALANYGALKRYDNRLCGFNCRLDPIQAAMLRVKLSYLEEENRNRLRVAEAYERSITNPLVIKPLMAEATDSCVWHQYVIRVGEARRDELKRYLEEKGVGTDIHYAVPPHLQPCYRALHHDPLPITERLAGEILSLPIAMRMTSGEPEEIAGIINSFG